MRSLDILVAVDGSEGGAAATRMALELAAGARSISTITGLHVVSVMRLKGRLLEDIAGLLGFQPVLVPERVEAFYQQRGEVILQEFERSCSQAGVKHRTVLAQGNTVDLILHHGERADLVVLGARGLTDEIYPGHGGRTAERVVKNLSATALLVPREMQAIRGLVLCYDGSDGSSKALRSARHLVEIKPVPVHAVYVCDRPPREDPLDEVRAYFQGRDVELHCHHMPGEPAETLLLATRQFDCNTIALGYRGRSGLRGPVLGRVTEWMLRLDGLALLISR